MAGDSAAMATKVALTPSVSTIACSWGSVPGHPHVRVSGGRLHPCPPTAARLWCAHEYIAARRSCGESSFQDAFVACGWPLFFDFTYSTIHTWVQCIYAV
jgi:hypothetical protein